ncbi:murein biosynthesis integral membrane protein MurJ [Herbivorax sp. ANBcel31]|uniref:murein biosynthesis integral membrane protein MurJ n=1 Tax=Herbivorax sp. ANBcel31 TaxID=3069754 RepID=UPI0027B20BD2|nr:murein biosynthesis integral membrane protein MurJ [Herbivorax sp. ANBcel31]MDQ2085623.1 murein biosynthesis integral membrane protein MurJ [Herbivorax sp. ANBcel31]
MKNTAKTVGIVMIIMVLSRFLSMISVIVYSTYFGNTLEMNVFTYALKFPNIVFIIFGTALATVVIPIFSGHLETGNKDRAYKFANNAISLTVMVTLVLSILGMLLAPVFPLMTEFRTEGYGFAVLSLRILFPVMIFYGLNYILQGILQSSGKFNMPAFVSVPSSLIMIGYVLLLGDKFGVTGLLIATFLALSTQALVLIPPTFKTEYRFKPSFDYKNEDVRKAVKLMIPIMIGTSAYQFNMFFDLTVTANFEDTVMIFGLVQNLVLNAVLAFIYSVTAVVFPKFSKIASRGDMTEFKNTLIKVLSSIVYFLIPATIGFILLREELISLLVGWGRITKEDETLASSILALYAMGITGVGIKEVVDRAFYSLKDTKKPAIIGVVVMVINIVLTLILINFIYEYGIPVGNAVSTLSGAFVILLLLRKKIGALGAANLMKSVLKIVFSSLIMAIFVVIITYFMSSYTFGVLLTDRLIKLLIPSLIGALIYFGLTYIFKVEEAVEVLNKIRRK